MEKRFELHGKTAEGRPLIHLVEPGSRYGLEETGWLDKTASGEHLPDVLELIEAIEPQPGRIYLVNSALGSGEFVGFNLRGDWFTERGLLHTPQNWDNIPVHDVDARRRAAASTEHVGRWGDMAWGYPTFYNAHRFRHHRNRNPDRAYGYVLGAFWDPRMHRVILVSELIEDLCRRLGAIDLYQRILRGEFPDTSMGAKVPFDRCSICNHVARTPREYCQHVRKDAMPPYGMRAILPDGRRCGVYNDYPQFFDDSFVFIGAERSAKVMDNVTDQVRGKNGYSSRVYTPPRRRMQKAASYNAGSATPMTSIGSPGAVPTNEKEEQEQELGKALARAASPVPKGPSSFNIGEQISKVLSIIPVANEQEQLALQHAADRLKRKAAIKDGATTKAELEIWSSKELQNLHRKGVTPDQVDRMRALVQHHLHQAFGTKTGSAAKWAEHLKEIPAPSEHQMALLADHVDRMPDLPPEVLDYIRDDMKTRLRALAALGVILRPSEFQYCSLPQDRAADCAAKKVSFSPVPLDPTLNPRWRMGAPSQEDMQAVSSRLGDLLGQRSLAPKVVMIRIIRPNPKPAYDTTPLTAEPAADLNKVAQQYNDYRMGLLAQLPDWRYVEAPMATPATLGTTMKVGATATAVSNLLLHLAYWPSLTIG